MAPGSGDLRAFIFLQPITARQLHLFLPHQPIKELKKFPRLFQFSYLRHPACTVSDRVGCDNIFGILFGNRATRRVRVQRCTPALRGIPRDQIPPSQMREDIFLPIF